MRPVHEKGSQSIGTAGIDRLCRRGDGGRLHLHQGSAESEEPKAALKKTTMLVLAVTLHNIPEGMAVGAVYSAVSVKSARKRNRAAIQAGRCEILQTDVSRLDLPADAYDLVTAFETVYFWRSIQRSFEHVLRVQKPGGRFLIVNESTGTDQAAVKFAKIIDGMNLYTPERLKELLEAAGFADIEIHQATDKPWIAAAGRKSM